MVFLEWSILENIQYGGPSVVKSVILVWILWRQDFNAGNKQFISLFCSYFQLGLNHRPSHLRWDKPWFLPDDLLFTFCNVFTYICTDVPESAESDWRTSRWFLGGKLQFSAYLKWQQQKRTIERRCDVTLRWQHHFRMTTKPTTTATARRTAYINKQQLCTCITLFCTFLCRRCTI